MPDEFRQLFFFFFFFFWVGGAVGERGLSFYLINMKEKESHGQRHISDIGCSRITIKTRACYTVKFQ